MSDHEQENWKHDLVSFYNMFHVYDPCSGKFGSATGLLTEQQVVSVARESGYMPKDEPGQRERELIEFNRELIGFDRILIG